MSDIQVKAIMAAVLYAAYLDNPHFNEHEAVELAERLLCEAREHSESNR